MEGERAVAGRDQQQDDGRRQAHSLAAGACLSMTTVRQHHPQANTTAGVRTTRRAGGR